MVQLEGVGVAAVQCTMFLFFDSPPQRRHSFITIDVDFKYTLLAKNSAVNGVLHLRVDGGFNLGGPPATLTTLSSAFLRPSDFIFGRKGARPSARFVLVF